MTDSSAASAKIDTELLLFLTDRARRTRVPSTRSAARSEHSEAVLAGNGVGGGRGSGGAGEQPLVIHLV